MGNKLTKNDCKPMNATLKTYTAYSLLSSVINESNIMALPANQMKEDSGIFLTDEVEDVEDEDNEEIRFVCSDCGFHASNLRPLLCEMCGEISNSFSNCITHHKLHHEIEGGFLCDYCGFSTNDFSSAIDHRKSHQENRKRKADDNINNEKRIKFEISEKETRDTETQTEPEKPEKIFHEIETQTVKLTTENETQTEVETKPVLKEAETQTEDITTIDDSPLQTPIGTPNRNRISLSLKNLKKRKLLNENDNNNNTLLSQEEMTNIANICCATFMTIVKENPQFTPNNSFLNTAFSQDGNCSQQFTPNNSFLNTTFSQDGNCSQQTTGSLDTSLMDMSQELTAERLGKRLQSIEMNLLKIEPNQESVNRKTEDEPPEVPKRGRGRGRGSTRGRGRGSRRGRGSGRKSSDDDFVIPTPRKRKAPARFVDSDEESASTSATQPQVVESKQEKQSEVVMGDGDSDDDLPSYLY